MLAAYVASCLVGATDLAPQGSWLEALVAAVFDPSWNLEHRAAIWATIVVVLFLSGVGLPMPEDIPLSLAGFTTFKQAHETVALSSFAVTFLVVATPILLGDLIAYSLGRRYGRSLPKRIRWLRRVFTERRETRVQRWFDSYGSFTVFLGRQVAGVRFVTFFTAGTMRVSLPRFVLFDFLGCLVSVPVWLTLGVLASRYGEAWLRVAAHKVGSGFLLASLGLFVVFFLVTKLRTLMRTAAAAKAGKLAE